MATEQMLPPEMPIPPEQAIPVEEGLPVEEAPIDEGIIESEALQDDETANKAAIKIITDSKKSMYGDRFDDYMEMLQSSQNIVEDTAMIAINELTSSLNAVESLGMGVPMAQIADLSAEVVSEVYDMAVQTGVYAPSNEEEAERNQNITLTMVAGELGKSFGSGESLPTDKVEGFIDSVMDGAYDDYNGDDMQGMAQGMPMGMPPEMGMPQEMGMPPEMAPQGIPPEMGMPPDAGLIQEEIV